MKPVKNKDSTTIRWLPVEEKVLEERLSHRAIKSGFWVFALRITQQVFNLIRIIILARILDPHDFGLMGIALLSMATLDTFSQTGFQTALIQKKENAEAYLDSAWTMLIIRGVILFIILYLIAPYAAAFFMVPRAKAIIQVIGLSFLIQAFTNIGIIYFQKELQFNKQFVYQLSGTVADFTIAVSAALILRDVWALVFGLLAGNITRLILSYIVHPYKPRVRFDYKEVKQLFGFGKWVLGSSILMFFITQGDVIFVGKLLGATMLGFYQMAYRISNIPATEITHVISQVAFPAYSKLQDDIPKLREAYLKVLQITAFLSFLTVGLIFVLAPDFTRIFLGEKWIPMLPAMQVLVFWGLIRSLGATTGPIMYAVGRPETITKYQLLQLFIFLSLIYPFTMHWGILGASCAVLFASIGANGLAFYAAIKITDCGINNFLRTISLPLTSLLAAMLPIFFMKMNWITLKVPIVTFLLSLLFYVFVYLGVSYLLDRFSVTRLRPLAKDMLLTLMRS